MSISDIRFFCHTTLFIRPIKIVALSFACNHLVCESRLRQIPHTVEVFKSSYSCGLIWYFSVIKGLRNSTKYLKYLDNILLYGIEIMILLTFDINTVELLITLSNTHLHLTRVHLHYSTKLTI
jgi:hypothetical protein